MQQWGHCCAQCSLLKFPPSHLVYDGHLHGLDGHRVLVDAQHAGALAGGGAHAPCTAQRGAARASAPPHRTTGRGAAPLPPPIQLHPHLATCAVPCLPHRSTHCFCNFFICVLRLRISGPPHPSGSEHCSPPFPLTRELREVVGLQQAVQRLPPPPLPHQGVPLRDQIAQGAACVGGGGRGGSKGMTLQ